MNKKKEIKKTETYLEHYVMAYETLFRFDWESVHNYMKSINWKWSDCIESEQKDSVPTIEDMKTKVETIMFECIGSAISGIKSEINNKNFTIESGGFQVHIVVLDNIIESISVNFITSSYTTHKYQ
jgi:hypothetical protein